MIQTVKNNKFQVIVGLILIVLALIILITESIDTVITTILWPLLEGSSEGKTVIFLGMIGFYLIFDVVAIKINLIENLYSTDRTKFRYLLFTIIILLICAFIGLSIELYLRYMMDISPFTILTSMNPYPATSSPMHSHAYKSVLGLISYYIVPTHVNSGVSILQYVKPFAFIVIPVWIVSFITGFIGFHRMNGLNKIINIIALTLSLIGLLDGGIFSQPFLIGIGFMWLIYYSDNNPIKLKHFVKPVVIMGYILLIAMICEIGGSDTTYHTLTVINQTEHVDMSSYNVIKVIQDGEKTTYIMNTTIPDKVLITSIFKEFYGKCDATFMSWNFYSYFENPNREILKNRKNISN